MATMFVNLAVRAWRWQYCSRRSGMCASAVRFARRRLALQPATCCRCAPGEVIRPYFLSRIEQVTTAGAFATIILERLLDMLTVLAMLAAYILFFAPPMTAASGAESKP